MIADLHIHSYLSRACSKQLHPEMLYRWCQLKGIDVLATGDWTHPKWIAELQEKCEPAEPGFFQLKPEFARVQDLEIYPSCKAPVRFVLGVEISSIYKKNGRVRKVHNLVFAPSFEVALKINATLDKIGNLKSDGRPILGLDSKRLLEILLDISDQAYLIPAHIWTPHFAVFGSESGFDSLEECFEDLTPHIFAVETGLSSDPLMNWRIAGLDQVTLISNSDAHSLEKLARESNWLDCDRSYNGLFNALKRKGKGRLVKTLEFFPEEGKYYMDGHRKCDVCYEPSETIQRKGICHACKKPVTVGVLHRIEKLASRAQDFRPKTAPDFEHLVPLKEIISQTLKVGTTSKKVDALYHQLLAKFGNEFSILRELDLIRLETQGYPLLALALQRMRAGKAFLQPGYDGEYGVISFLQNSDFRSVRQLSML